MALHVRAEPSSTDMCAPAGREVVALTLVAGRPPNETPYPIEVVQLHDNAREPVTLTTTAIDGMNVVASGNKNPELWRDHVEIGTVAACSGRRIEVSHAGRVVTLEGSGTPSNALAGTLLKGPWELRSPMSPPEQSTPALRPKDLTVVTTLRCRGGTP